MKKIELKSRKLLRTILGSISLTTMAFIFQACYGPSRDYYFHNVKLTGTVSSKTTNLPIKGIKVTVNEGVIYGYTDDNGNFDFYADVCNCSYYENDIHYTPDKVSVHFLDIDGIENGSFRDTTIIVNRENKNEVKINIQLSEKQ